jgi:hypothetical protein
MGGANNLKAKLIAALHEELSAIWDDPRLSDKTREHVERVETLLEKLNLNARKGRAEKGDADA